MPATIRPAVPADLPAITAIYADAVLHGTASYELTPPDLAEMERRFRALTAEDYPFLAAELDGRWRPTPMPACSAPGPPTVSPRRTLSIYVAPGAKGRGLGRLLLSRLVAECEKVGFRQLVAVIGDGHAASASVILHERLGFRHAGRTEGSGFKHGRWLDTVFMQLPLSGGAGTPPDPRSAPERRFQRGEQARG